MKKTAVFLSFVGLFLLLSVSLSPSGSASGKISTQKRVYHADSLLYKLMEGHPLPEPQFVLTDVNLNKLVDYCALGVFRNAGTVSYHYDVTDMKGLKEAVGAGIYPDTDGVLNDPLYLRLREQAMLNVGHWESLKLEDPQRAFYIWAQASEEKGIQAFFTGHVLENSGHILPAIKAYYATLVHFPDGICWAADRSFVWYVAQSALQNIQRLTQDYPQLNLELVGASFSVQNGYDPDLDDDIIKVDPGRLARKTLDGKKENLPDLNALDIIGTRGQGRVQLVQFSNRHWQMLVDGKPFFMRAISYNPTVIGIGPQSDRNFMARWMFSDVNQNGLNDAAYDAWVDKNRNEVRDEDEEPVGDFQLMKDMGINAIRLYVENNPVTEYDPSLINKPLLRDMYERYGIGVIAGDFLGAYTVGSGATWEAGTDYSDPKQRAKMKAAVRAKVLDLKDEPFVLMWVLGNENNVGHDYMGHNATRTNASVNPKAYARFLNEVAAMIHEIDGNHPVAVGNVELGLLEYYADYAPELDIMGINSYRGTVGFGSLWENARMKFDRPILIAEYGCDAYYQDKGEDGEGQQKYLEGKFRDIIFNQAGGPGAGNSIGGVIFEYLDEWWKDAFGHPEDVQQRAAQFPLEFPDGLSHEEWFGIVGQGDGKHSPFKRQLREGYEYFKELEIGSPISLYP